MKAPTILFLGDSLTYGYMVPQADSMPSRIEGMLSKAGRTTVVINGGVSGDTVEMAARRLPYYLERFPEISFIAVFLGANDVLMQEEIPVIEKDFRSLIEGLRRDHSDIKIRIMAFGPLPGISPAYQEAMAKIYSQMADLAGTDLIPFPMRDIVGRPMYNLADGLHPNSEGYRIMAEHVWSHIKDDLL